MQQESCVECDMKGLDGQCTKAEKKVSRMTSRHFHNFFLKKKNLLKLWNKTKDLKKGDFYSIDRAARNMNGKVSLGQGHVVFTLLGRCL